ncbi:MAG: hypothetical protein M3Q81_02145 [bacterium]|nr:hypothetical protein [bacterium]
MIDQDKTQQLKNLMAEAHSVMILLGPTQNRDQVIAAQALADGLLAKGKNVIMASPMPVNQAWKISGTVETKSEIGNRDLMVSFPFIPESVDKVSYHINENDNKFYLVVKPQSGKEPLAADKVEFSYAGAETDLIILLGVHDLESLQQLYYGYEQLYESTTIVTLHTFEPTIGSLKLDISGASSFSEAVIGIMGALEAPLDETQATQLLSAIEEATDSFRSFSTQPETFEVVAYLMRAGARRLRRDEKAQPEQSTSQGAAKSKSKKSFSKSGARAGGLDYHPNSYSPSAGG